MGSTDSRWSASAAAANPICPPRTLAGLAEYPDTAVRAAAAANPSCSASRLALLAGDVWEVQTAAAKTLWRHTQQSLLLRVSKTEIG